MEYIPIVNPQEAQYLCPKNTEFPITVNIYGESIRRSINFMLSQLLPLDYAHITNSFRFYEVLNLWFKFYLLCNIILMSQKLFLWHVLCITYRSWDTIKEKINQGQFPEKTFLWRRECVPWTSEILLVAFLEFPGLVPALNGKFVIRQIFNCVSVA